MPVDASSFVFIIALAGIVNGLGIVRWLTVFAEYLRLRSTVRVVHYWVFTLSAGLQFLLHILFWWSLWTLRGDATINFLSYLYVLSGPILLYLGTALLTPNVDGDKLDLRQHYFAARSVFSNVLFLLWLWALFVSPMLRGSFAPTAPVFIVFLANALVMRATTNATIQGISAIVNWVLFVALIAHYFLQLGGPST